MIAKLWAKLFAEAKGQASDAPDVDAFEQEESFVSIKDGRIDQYSDTWIYVEAWARSEIDRLRSENDSLKLSEAQTAALRGGIRRMKDLIDLPNRKERKRLRQQDEEEF